MGWLVVFALSAGTVVGWLGCWVWYSGWREPRAKEQARLAGYRKGHERGYGLGHDAGQLDAERRFRAGLPPFSRREA